MDPFKLKKLGRSDVELPQFGLGCAPIGELFTRVSEAEAEATLQAAWDAGVRYYDTAPWYGRGLSEHRLGRLLYRQERSQLLLSTKVGRILRAPRSPENFDTGFWSGGMHFDVVFDYSYDGVMRAYEDSLQRLGMNRIDLLVIHDLDLENLGHEAVVEAKFAQLINGGFRALQDLKNGGLVGAIGAGVNDLGTIPRFLELFDLDFFLLAQRYTLGDHSALENELPLCGERGVGVIIGAVFSSGLYASGPVPGAKFNYVDALPEDLEKARKIADICRRHDVPLAAAALQFPLYHPSVASVIPGTIAPNHVLSNLELMRTEIPDSLWRDLKEQRLVHGDAPTPG